MKYKLLILMKYLQAMVIGMCFTSAYRMEADIWWLPLVIGLLMFSVLILELFQDEAVALFKPKPVKDKGWVKISEKWPTKDGTYLLMWDDGSTCRESMCDGIMLYKHEIHGYKQESPTMWRKLREEEI